MRNLIIATSGVTILLAILAGITVRGFYLMQENLNQGERDVGFTREVLPRDPDIEIMKRCAEAKNQVAGEWINGEITLPEAAEEYRTINASRPPHLPASLKGYPGNSEEERLCRQVMMYAEFILRGRSDAKAVLARLESELETYVAKIRSTPPSVPSSRATVPAID